MSVGDYVVTTGSAQGRLWVITAEGRFEGFSPCFTLREHEGDTIFGGARLHIGDGGGMAGSLTIRVVPPQFLEQAKEIYGRVMQAKHAMVAPKRELDMLRTRLKQLGALMQRNETAFRERLCGTVVRAAWQRETSGRLLLPRSMPPRWVYEIEMAQALAEDAVSLHKELRCVRTRFAATSAGLASHVEQHAAAVSRWVGLCEHALGLVLM